MKADIKAKWVAALRSGDFEQGMEVLRTVYSSGCSYCCLGVLCEIVEPNGWCDDYEPQWSGAHILAVSWGDECLNEYALAEFGLTDEDQKTLIKMNDSGKSFAHIADWIEANL